MNLIVKQALLTRKRKAHHHRLLAAKSRNPLKEIKSVKEEEIQIQISQKIFYY
jgi:hypothetical protein